jgi:hypothetical protein
MNSTLVKFYGETDEFHREISENLDLYYRVQYLYFGDQDGDCIEPNYSFRYASTLSAPQKALLEKIRYLSKANVVVSIQSLMDSLGVNSPLTVLNILNNLSEQKAILNFKWPEVT